MLRNTILRMAIKRVIRTPTPRNVRYGYPILPTTSRTMSTSWNNHSFPTIDSRSHRYFATDNGDKRRGMKADMEKDMNDTSTEDENAKANKGYDSDLKAALIERLKSCRRGDRKKIPEIMVELHTLLKKPIDWMPVLGAYINVGDLQGGYKLLEKMRQRNCKPNVFIYSKLITALVRAGRLDKVEMLRREMKEEGVKPNIYTYATILKFYVNNLEEVEKLCKDMEENGVTPNVIFNNTLMTAYIKNQEKVEEIFEEIKEVYKEWRLVKQMSHEDMDEEEKDISKMKEEDVKPNDYTYNTVMDANDVERVEELFKEMKSYGIKPNVVAYNTRMNANVGDVERVEEIWKEMIADGIKPNDYAYNIQMKANIDDVERVEELFEEMKENGIKPDDVTYNTRMDANVDDVDRVEELWKEMIEKGIKPNGQTYSTIIPAHYKAGNTDRVEELSKEAKAAGFGMFQ